MAKSLLNHWLHGEQMEGFLPCPFCGDLPYVKFDNQEAFGQKTVWVRLTSNPFGISIKSCLFQEVGVGSVSTEEVARAQLLERLKRMWNTRSTKEPNRSVEST